MKKTIILLILILTIIGCSSIHKPITTWNVYSVEGYSIYEGLICDSNGEVLAIVYKKPSEGFFTVISFKEKIEKYVNLYQAEDSTTDLPFYCPLPKRRK